MMNRNGMNRNGRTRREVLATSVGALSLFLVKPVRATPAAMAEAIDAFVGKAEVKTGKVHLDLPPLVENGNSAPLTVGVESPMTADDFVRTIAVFNERNPQSQVAVFHLGPRAGRAFVSTRMRLATSQRVTAIAQLGDGSFWSASTDVIVTLAACIEG
jgi:sulfur-oxidizing protein SoxY